MDIQVIYWLRSTPPLSRIPSSYFILFWLILTKYLSYRCMVFTFFIVIDSYPYSTSSQSSSLGQLYRERDDGSFSNVRMMSGEGSSFMNRIRKSRASVILKCVCRNFRFEVTSALIVPVRTCISASGRRFD